MSLSLVTTIKNGDIEIIKDMVKNGMNVNGRGATDYRLVDFAMEYNQLEIFKILLEAGAETTILNINGKNVLHRAVLSGRMDYVEVLLDGGYSDINAGDDKGNTPLHLASINNDISMIEFFVSKKFKAVLDVSLTNDDGKTPLEEAASFPHYEVVRVLAHGKSVRQEQAIQKLFLDNDTNLESIILSASKMIMDLKSELETTKNERRSEEAGVLKAEIDRMRVENANMMKSLKFKDNLNERLRRTNLDLKESLLEEKLSNETLVSNMEQMQSQLDLVGEIDVLQKKVGSLQ